MVSDCYYLLFVTQCNSLQCCSLQKVFAFKFLVLIMLFVITLSQLVAIFILWFTVVALVVLIFYSCCHDVIDTTFVFCDVVSILYT